MKTNYCLSCGCEQQIVCETDFHCDRCGAMNRTDGSCEYDASRRGFEDMQDNIDFYESGERDRDDWERHHR